MRKSMKHIKLCAAVISLLLSFSATLLVPTAIAGASPQSVVCSTLGSSSSCGSTPSNGIDLNKTISAVVTILSIVVGIVAVIMVIIGGFKYVTSNGDSSAISNAKTTITYALVGLVIATLAQSIVYFVLDKTKG
jgi:hypothetical protein